MDSKKKKIIIFSVIFWVIVLIIILLLIYKATQYNFIKLNDLDYDLKEEEKNDTNEKFAYNNSNYVSSYFAPIVPKGFEKVETATASWEEKDGEIVGWNKGLVIKDKIGNEFVWVPAKHYDIYEEIAFNGYMDQAKRDSEKEKEQIDKYGGFYIARYEAGVSDEMMKNINQISSKTNNVQGIPVSKKGVLPWNFINLKNALQNAQNMYKDSSSVESSLFTELHEFYIAKWLKETGCDITSPKDYGNFVNSHFKFTGYYSIDDGISYTYGEDVIKQTYNMILSTGASDYTLTNNIYDLAGNVQEFTNTFNEYGGYFSVGGYYSQLENKFFYLSSAIGDKTPLEKLGFRVVLYIK